jgi:putative hemolysin
VTYLQNEMKVLMMQILLLIGILIFVNAFFAASEMALVSIKPLDIHRLKTQKKKHASALERVVSDSTKYLSTIQVAITIAGFISSAFAGSRLSGRFVNLLETIHINIPNSVAVVIITLILSFVTLVIGELVPKRIAITNPTKFALFCAPIILVFMKLFTPFVALLSVSTTGVLKLLRIKSKKGDASITEGEIKEMIVYGQIEGLYKREEKNMMKRIFSLDDLTAKMIMTPKDQIIALYLAEKNIDEVIASRYSRIPVFEDKASSIKGVIFLKELLIKLKDFDIESINFDELLRKPVMIHESVKLNVLLKQMRDTFEHFTFIVNDHDELIGIVTLEDIIEEIVGNIYDEHDFVTESSESLSEFGYIFDGDMLISDIEQKLGIKLGITNTNQTLSHFIHKEFSKRDKTDENTIVKLPVGTLKVLTKRNHKMTQVELKLDQDKVND